jgi:hypothetical protein
MATLVWRTTRTKAPIFKNLRRIVPQIASAKSVSQSPIRRKAHTSRYAFPERKKVEAFLSDPEIQDLFKVRHDTTASKLVLVDGCT